MSNELQHRTAGVFGALVVNKKAALLGGLERIPRFVTEYLIAAARARRSDADLAEVRAKIRKHAIDADRKNEFISTVMRESRGTLITLLDVEPVPQRNEHVARIAQLDGHELGIDEVIVRDNPELLYGGMWGSVVLRYDTTGPKPLMVVERFEPYQLARPDTEAFRRGRAHFTFDEWVDLMVTSAGYSPASLPTLRHKLLLLTRLVPLAENNVNLVELGPRNTGKSYLLRNLSSRVYLSSGARATPATFFYDLAKKRLGLVGVKKVVVMDEITATAIPDQAFAAALLDYMESGAITRGGRQFTSDCSLVFTGNIELGADGKRPRSDYPHLFSVFPKELTTSAIVDRIHGFIPGWELPKITDQLLSDEVGFLSDYFGEVLTELRRDPLFTDLVRDRIRNLCCDGGEVTIRDRRAIERVLTGLTRILFPNGEIEDGPFEEMAQVAIELRARVHKQLTKMSPGEYKEKSLRWTPTSPPPRLPEELDRAVDELDDQVNEQAVIGMITMLYTYELGGGGDRGFVQCRMLPGRGLTITGLRGQVLEHSIQTAHQTLQALADDLDLPPQRLQEGKMAVHLVNIADLRDGPSAGLAFALAMLSAATKRPLRRGLAVTGELSLHGNVRPVGGIPEKLHAAKRRGRSRVIIPWDNRDQLAQVPELVRSLDVRPVRTIQEAVALAFE